MQGLQLLPSQPSPWGTCSDYATLLEQVCGNNAASTSGHLRGFRLFLKTYVYDIRTGTFELVPGMPGHLPHQICQAVKALQLIETAGTEESAANECDHACG